MPTSPDTPTPGVTLTSGAIDKVRSLLEKEGRDDLRLRLVVQPGGCAGFSYGFVFDERILDGDAIRDFDGVEVIVDRESTPRLEGATVDYVDTLQRQGFAVDNPNADSTCSCGNSFC
jgi:iron-sulfur cluster assembly accessory protein